MVDFADIPHPTVGNSPINEDQRVRLIDENATHDERMWATLMHLGGFSGIWWGPLSVLVPLVMWLMKRDESPFIDDHGKEAINFQLSIWLWVLVSVVLILCGIGIIMLFVIPVFSAVMMIINAIHANKGEYIRYPVTVRFIS